MKSILILILGVIVLQMNICCKSKNDTSEMKETFTEEEIEDLFKLTDFFKKQICSDEKSNFSDCYKMIPHDFYI